MAGREKGGSDFTAVFIGMITTKGDDVLHIFILDDHHYEHTISTERLAHRIPGYFGNCP